MNIVVSRNFHNMHNNKEHDKHEYKDHVGFHWNDQKMAFILSFL